MIPEHLLSRPAERRGWLAAAEAAVTEVKPDMLVSGTEALVLTSMLAGELRLPMAYLRPKPKTHGRQQRVEGKLSGANLLLVTIDPKAEATRDYVDLVAENGARVARLLVLGPRSVEFGIPSTHVPSPVATGEGKGEGTHSPPTGVAGAEDVARALLRIGAVIVRSEPFRYASGLLSPIYTDCRLLISFPDEWQLVLSALQARIEAMSFDAIDGVATSGIPHASVLACRLDKPLVYVDDAAIAGESVASKQVVIVEDLVTTGKSVLAAAGPLRQAGAKLKRCCAIFTYDPRQPSLDAAAIALEPLSDLETLLRVGVEDGFFGPAEREAVVEWRRDPQAWTAAHEPA